jgi:cholesterol oxidase
MTDVIVIGTGFGGAFVSLRLAQAGFNVEVFERGAWWNLPDATFGDPPAPWQKKDAADPLFAKVGLTGVPLKVTWRRPAGDRPLVIAPAQKYDKKRPGFVERLRLTKSNAVRMDAFGGACVGGGSLVYGAMKLKPRLGGLRVILPPAFPIHELDKHFDNVQQHIGFRAPTQAEQEKLEGAEIGLGFRYASQARLREKGIELGLDVEPVQAAIDWTSVVARLDDAPPPSAAIGEYVFGANDGTKLSLDRTVWPKALDHANCTLHALREVSHLEKTATGWRVFWAPVGEDGEVGVTAVSEAKWVFLCAGSVHTTRLLLKLQQSSPGTFAVANPALGKKWGTNGDVLSHDWYPGNPSSNDGGPCYVSLVPPTTTADEMPAWRIVQTPGPNPLPGMVNELGMTPLPPAGTLTCDASGELSLDWNAQQAHTGTVTIRAHLRQLGGVVNPVDDHGGYVAVTYHPLGGVQLGVATNLLGAVNGLENLIVADGSLLPGHCATCNPSWTIAALADYLVHKFIAAERPGSLGALV